MNDILNIALNNCCAFNIHDEYVLLRVKCVVTFCFTGLFTVPGRVGVSEKNCLCTGYYNCHLEERRK